MGDEVPVFGESGVVQLVSWRLCEVDFVGVRFLFSRSGGNAVDMVGVLKLMSWHA